MPSSPTSAPSFGRYEELRPDQLSQIVRRFPIAYWPLGLIEHHGWHLPVGFDGIKAQRICERLAARSGGVLLPVMWWGAGGGHGPFRWTHYQSHEAAGEILATTTRQLLRFGFRAVVFLAGHYPWQQILDARLAPIQQEHPQALLLWGTEMSIGGWDLKIPGDHAAREETSFGLSLLPEHVDLGALRPGRTAEEAWPQGVYPAGQVPDVVKQDPADPLFSQAGQDARLAGAQRGEEAIGRLVARLAEKLEAFLDSHR